VKHTGRYFMSASVCNVMYFLLVLKDKLETFGPLQPVIVKLGEDVILPCHLKPAEDAAGMTFEWARPDLNPRFVHVWHERQDLHVNQHPSYKGRTSVSINGLKQGDISLALSKVKISDNGIYRCYFPDVEKASTVHLIIGTASFPAIGLAGIDRSSSGVVLQCESKGWYPEPEVVWLDGEGNLLSAGPTETVRGPDDLYTVSSRVTFMFMLNFTEVLIPLNLYFFPGQVQQIGPLQPVVVMVDDDIVLPCQLEPPVNAVSMTMEWGRPDLEPRFVYVWHDGQELLADQNQAYKGRASLSIDRLKLGDLSLNLYKVTISDNGRYRCFIPKLNKEYFVELLVGAVSSPGISLAGIHKANSAVMLDCRSKGWYPEPEVVWLDSEGNLLSAGPTETVRGPDDLYTVSSRVTVEKRHSNNFTCRVQQKDINQTRETHIYVPGRNCFSNQKFQLQ
uniref:Ig-like domain-containing protein n=1 Tax=Dicentrarchus labrax TaxID=13489 RepID=A0A8C4GUH5_DICLA